MRSTHLFAINITLKREVLYYTRVWRDIGNNALRSVNSYECKLQRLILLVPWFYLRHFSWRSLSYGELLISPLDLSKKEIRLLVLDPSNSSDQVSDRIIHSKILSGSEHLEDGSDQVSEYEALSYSGANRQTSNQWLEHLREKDSLSATCSWMGNNSVSAGTSTVPSPA